MDHRHVANDNRKIYCQNNVSILKEDGLVFISNNDTTLEIPILLFFEILDWIFSIKEIYNLFKSIDGLQRITDCHQALAEKSFLNSYFNKFAVYLCIPPNKAFVLIVDRTLGPLSKTFGRLSIDINSDFKKIQYFLYGKNFK